MRWVGEKLLKRDPSIVEIVQFGSSVYAPDLSRDVDLLVISRGPKDYDVYLDAVESALRVAQRILKLALETRDPLDRDRLFRKAFDLLFHAARIATMTYLSTEVARWGLLRRMLPKPYNRRFRELIDVLHIKYFYNEEYPKDRVEEEFNKWCGMVEKFIKTLEHETKQKQ